MLVLLALFAVPTTALDNGLARTPQMGWNNWNAYGCDINETIILENAHALVDTGLKDLGYNYLVMDDCWSLKHRSPTGQLIPDPAKFPSGITALVNQIHSLGLLFGMYADAGLMTCGMYPGSLGYEQQDAQQFAAWQIDYLKYDNCYNQGESGPHRSFERYKAMSDALNATGRPILYSMCNWGENYTPNWATTIANSFRISGDVGDSFDRFDARCPCQTFECESIQGYHCSFMNIIEKVVPYGQKAHPGAWNDMDILEIGNGGASVVEYKTQFSLWAINKSPLLLGNKLHSMTQETLEIVSNEEVIALSQDPMGRPAVRIWRKEASTGTPGNVQLWSGELAQDAQVVAILNATPEEMRIEVTFADIFLDARDKVNQAFHVRDLWLHENLGIHTHHLVATVPAHGTALFKLRPALATHSGL
ncbi:alpha-galactosidase [Protomyces lactucae-debilis]|uniref:Alpha-galactosidase n=1 Tax=Protomyces lactucae-debilis TaxID=2754530 RepID=A0A1Y2FSP5_PROLT|nr:alpha-galactosidase [Protomyces lactucae-debilis]ORY86206.1 alpha-galactosidase [Protomyces lactucae-debilis]